MCYTIITKGMTGMAKKKYVVEIINLREGILHAWSEPMPKDEAIETMAVMLKPSMFGTKDFRVRMRKATKEEKKK